MLEGGLKGGPQIFYNIHKRYTCHIIYCEKCSIYYEVGKSYFSMIDREHLLNKLGWRKLPKKEEGKNARRKD